MNYSKYKWLKWEFWPFWLFYIPIYFQYISYGIRSGSFGFFTAANPLMEYGGWNAYSKHNVLDKIATDYLPKTTLLKFPFEKNPIDLNTISYPVILKPDMGERGFSVEKIDNREMLDDYLSKSKQDIILQEFISYPLEFGIMYHRFLGEEKGHITSVVKKEVLSVTGDGESTLRSLIEQGERTAFHVEMLFENHKDSLNSIPQKGEEVQLSDIGNHIRGATFYNANHIINEQLHTVFDRIAVPIEGFHFGRFDIKVPSEEDLYAGKNIKILELNGVNSEPTHIYDPEMPLLKAYKDLMKHWSILFRISRKNHKNGTPYTSIWEIIRAMKKYFRER